MKNLHVAFELPASLASEAGLNLDDLSRDVRRMLALFLFEHKRISPGKACELGEMSYWEFYDLNTRLGISLPYSPDDLKDDLAPLEDG